MKEFNVLILLLLITATSVSAQLRQPVKWSLASKMITSQEAVIYIKAIIQDGWHIYGLHVPPGGPVSTKFTFFPSNDYTAINKIAAPATKRKYEKDFKMNIPYYEKEVVFQQKIKRTKAQTSVKGTVSFMCCNAMECLPENEYRFIIPMQ